MVDTVGNRLTESIKAVARVAVFFFFLAAIIRISRVSPAGACRYTEGRPPAAESVPDR